MYNEIQASEAMYPTRQHDWPVVEPAVEHELHIDNDNNHTVKVVVSALRANSLMIWKSLNSTNSQSPLAYQLIPDFEEAVPWASANRRSVFSHSKATDAIIMTRQYAWNVKTKRNTYP